MCHLLEHTGSHDDESALLRSSSHSKSFVSVRYYRLESNLEVSIFTHVYIAMCIYVNTLCNESVSV